MIVAELERLRSERMAPSEADRVFLEEHGLADLQNAVTFEHLLRRPDFSYRTWKKSIPVVFPSRRRSGSRWRSRSSIRGTSIVNCNRLNVRPNLNPAGFPNPSILGSSGAYR
jgi:hypothetical protein